MEFSATAARRQLWAPLAAGSILVVFTAWVFGRFGGAHTTLAFVDIASFLVPLAAAAACAWRASRAGGVQRLAWTLIGLGCMSWAVGQAAWATYVLRLGQETPPFPGIPDIGYLAMVPLACLGLMSIIAGPAIGTNRLRVLLEASIVGLSLLVVSWGAVLRDVTGTTFGDGVTFADLVYLAYPTGDVVVTSLAIMLMVRAARRDQAMLALLAAGFVAIAVADTVYVIQGIQQIFTDATFVHTGWIAGFLLVALAALRPITTGAVPTTRPTVGQAAVPYIPFAIAVLSTLESVREHGSLEPFMAITLAGAAMMVLVHAVVILVENLRLRASVEAALDAKQAAEAERLLMLNSIAHDLANSLTPLRFRLSALSHSRHLGEEELKGVSVATRSTEQVVRLVADLRDVALLQGGGLTFVPQVADLTLAARNVLDGAGPDAAACGVSLRLNAPEALPVLTDATRFTQVLGNLVGNAIKFTPAGGTVSVKLSAEGPTVKASVTDTGRGLDADEVTRLFRPFVQVHDRTTQRAEHRGTGLGLYICKGILERQGGGITVASEGRGKGSTFSFWFKPSTTTMEGGQAASTQTTRSSAPQGTEAATRPRTDGTPGPES